MELDLKTLFELEGIHATPHQLKSFQLFEDELMIWNEKFNLTAISNREGIRVKHFLDSLTCLKAMPSLKNQKIIDIGTGAGFPGIPLKVPLPQRPAHIS